MPNPNLSNPKKLVNEARLNEYHQTILPYLGGHIECGFTPVGAVIMMSGNEAPKHYLKCDGTVYNIADYPELAAFYARSQGSCNFYGGNGTTTFAVPDLRGEFVRGTGTNSHANNGNGSAVGAHQDATRYPKIAQWGNAEIGFTGATGENTGITYADANVDSSSTAKVWKKMTVSGTAGTGGTDLMTFKPTNTSVLFCVSSKNIYLDARFDYSLEEKVVGTWIDGKPIYEQTRTVNVAETAVASVSTTMIDSNTTHKIISATGIDSKLNYVIPFNNFNQANGNNYVSGVFTFNNSGVTLGYMIKNGSAGSIVAAHTITVTWKYTKTTDA